ncbi:glycogen debranching protein [Leptolyngbya ohadii]|uniref:glycogen debranching protein n=1 Tax=Leptolyngbya ohadii TaxID=1962290 RepID=UPI0034E2957D
MKIKFRENQLGEQEAIGVKIWVNEQIDSSGIIRACIACCDAVQAQECHDSFEANLTAQQKQEGWFTRMREVESWDEVPVNALKLD